jgi:hypothetical protein
MSPMCRRAPIRCSAVALSLRGALCAWLAASCTGGAFSVRDVPLDLPPSDDEYVKHERLGEGALPTGARALLGTLVVDGPLDPELLRDALVLRGQRIGNCYAGALASAPRRSGDLVLLAHIGFDGVLDRLDVLHDSTGDRSLARCVTNGIRGMRFLEAERRPDTRARLPLRFVPPQPPPSPSQSP